MYPLRTPGKGTFEWGVKIARIWVHKSTILAGSDHFHRVGMVAIFFEILKNENPGAYEKKWPLFETLWCHNAPQIALLLPRAFPVSEQTPSATHNHPEMHNKINRKLIQNRAKIVIV